MPHGGGRMNEQEADPHATPDLRTWSKVLAGYREASNARSALEILITVVPLVLLWVLMWASLDIGYWLCLLLSVPAAGFLVRLFIIPVSYTHLTLPTILRVYISVVVVS